MKTTLAIVATVIMSAAVGCTSEDRVPMDGSPAPTTAGESLSAHDLVAARWSGPAGDPVPTGVVNVIRGPEHCDWQSSLWLHLGWPVGTPAETASDIRQYVRDPGGVLPESVEKEASLALDAELPEAAEPTGYDVNTVELWLGEDGGDDAVYVVFADHVERWPRTAEVIACG